MQDILDYDRSVCTDAADVIVASGDAYYALIDNDIVDMSHFSSEDAGAAEKICVREICSLQGAGHCAAASVMQDADASAYKDMPREWQAYLSYIVNDVLTGENGVIVSGSIDTEDQTYQQWKTQETINVYNVSQLRYFAELGGLLPSCRIICRKRAITRTQQKYTALWSPM